MSYVYIYGEPENQENLKTAKMEKQRNLLWNLPWDGVVFLGLSGTGIILTVLLSPHHEKMAAGDLNLVTFYIGFSLYGILDIIINFNKEIQHQTLLRYLCLGVALMVNGVLHIQEVQKGRMADVLTMVTIAVALFSILVITMGIKANALLVICLMLQGTWRMHSAFIEDHEWTQLYFSWHLIIISLAYLVLISIQRQKEVSLDSECHESKFSSLQSQSTHRTEVKDLNYSFLEKQMPVYCTTGAPSGLSVLDTQPPNLAQMDNVNEREGYRSPSSTSTLPCATVPVLCATLSESSTKQSEDQLQKQQQQRCAQLKSQQHLQKQSHQEANSDTAVYENTHLKPSLSEPSCVLFRPDNTPVDKSATPVNSEPHKLVDSEPVDRISPIEEFNTLNRHVNNVRASIKLKESKFV